MATLEELSRRKAAQDNVAKIQEGVRNGTETQVSLNDLSPITPKYGPGDPDDHATYIGNKNFGIGDPDDHATYLGNKNFEIGDPDDSATFLGSQAQLNQIQASAPKKIEPFTYAAAPTFSYGGGGSSLPAFSYENAPQYTNAYQEQINQMIDGILNKDAFSYDVNTDPLYAQYKDQYTRLGNQAMTDTLGQVSARTGGLASSYAGTAAQQAYNGYMQQLADKVPELYNLAYSMYQDRDKTERQNLAMIQALENQDYGRYTDLLNQYNNARNLAYSQYQDKLSQANADRNFAYKVYQDQLSQYNRDKEYAYNQYLSDNGLSNSPDYMSILNDDRASTAEKLYAASQLGLTNSTQLAGLGLDGKTTQSKAANHQEVLNTVNEDVPRLLSEQGKDAAISYVWEAKDAGLLDPSEYAQFISYINK